MTDDPLPVEPDPDDERTWYCIFCGKQLGDTYPYLNGEVSWAGGDYAEFAAHPNCFEAAADQSIRDEGYFDATTNLPMSKLPALPAPTADEFIVVAEFRPPDARDQFRQWRRTNAELLNDVSRESIRVETRYGGEGESFTVSLAAHVASRSRLG